jgi:hypothetical protein
MTVLDRVRRWLFGPETDQSTSDDGTDTETETTDEPQLDPDNVTQVRSTREDDPVSQLNDLQQDSDDGDKSDD